MTGLVDTIRDIGIFMLVAQTVLHFAAGKQYEKYTKSITSVILLMLFIEPFSASGKDAVAYWREQMEVWEREAQRYFDEEKTSVYTAGTTAAALDQIEEKVVDRLNAALSDDICRVTDVEIDLEETEEEGINEKVRSWEFQRVRVTVESSGVSELREDGGQREIRIDRITVGGGTENTGEEQKGAGTAQDGVLRECREVFARTLGVDEAKVEVIWCGEGERTVKEDYGR